MTFLSTTELPLITFYQSVLHEAAHGPYFPEAEFATIFGFQRAEIAAFARQLSKALDSNEIRAINAAFNNLLGYPHQLDQHFPWTREVLDQAFVKFRLQNVPNAEAMIGATSRYAPRVTVATVVEKDGKFLFVEERILDRLVLNQPAGHLDPHETLVAGAERETFEETGWQVRVDSLISIDQLETPTRAFIRFAFAATALSFDAAHPLDEGIERTLWLTPTELSERLADHRSELVAAAVRRYQAGQRYPLSLLRMFQS
jgi:8-oxo-dGTP pyrophosphatase MutT (NUDIX family)